MRLIRKDRNPFFLFVFPAITAACLALIALKAPISTGPRKLLGVNHDQQAKGDSPDLWVHRKLTVIDSRQGSGSLDKSVLVGRHADGTAVRAVFSDIEVKQLEELQAGDTVLIEGNVRNMHVGSALVISSQLIDPNAAFSNFSGRCADFAVIFLLLWLPLTAFMVAINQTLNFILEYRPISSPDSPDGIR